MSLHSEGERWRGMPDEEAVALIRRELKVDEVRARFALLVLRGEAAGDASLKRPGEEARCSR